MTRPEAAADRSLASQNACAHGGAFFDAIGDSFDDLSRRRDVINADVLDAWFPPSPRIAAAIAPHLEWLIATSPPTGCEGLVRTIADVRGVSEANVLPGAGSSELIYLALRTRLTSGARVLLLDPTYGEYAHVLGKVIGCTVERFTLSRVDGYRVDPVQFAARLRDGFDLVVIVNPNSPTGVHLDRDALESVIAGAPSTTSFWVDETYVEYAGPGASLERFAAASPSTTVCKSMSKVYALSGMRAAYLVGPEAAISRLRMLTPPWAVGLIAQVAAVEALRDPAYYEAKWRETHVLRAALERSLVSEIGADVVHGGANFVLFHLPSGAPTATQVVKSCRERGLFIRDFPEMASLGPAALRVAVKDAATNTRMIEILRGAVQL
ncbi:MAG: histidinol-phosphate aminotransferase family protein [Planctomycetes bacterium]|nr:histidinol-phosphate aminotransferase family protein [Planctomycetota bacterium]